MRFDNDVASIANDIYQRMSPYQDEMCFDIVAEFTRDKYYTSATYIKTARGVIKQIKQYNRYAARTAAKENNSQRA